MKMNFSICRQACSLLFFKTLIAPALIGFFVWACAIPAACAADLLLGRVVSVDLEKGEFSVTVVPSPASEEETALPESAAMPAPPEHGATEAEVVTVVVSADKSRLFIPGCVQPGEIVRIWGDFSAGSKKTFMADDIRGTRGRRMDSSGVRSRLNRGANFRRQEHRAGGNGGGGNAKPKR